MQNMTNPGTFRVGQTNSSSIYDAGTVSWKTDTWKILKGTAVAVTVGPPPPYPARGAGKNVSRSDRTKGNLPHPRTLRPRSSPKA